MPAGIPSMVLGWRFPAAIDCADAAGFGADRLAVRSSDQTRCPVNIVPPVSRRSELVSFRAHPLS